MTMASSSSLRIIILLSIVAVGYIISSHLSSSLPPSSQNHQEQLFLRTNENPGHDQRKLAALNAFNDPTTVELRSSQAVPMENNNEIMAMQLQQQGPAPGETITSLMKDRSVFECPTYLKHVIMEEPFDGIPHSPELELKQSNTNVNAMQAPQIVSFRLDKEKDSPHYIKTLDSLAQHDYTKVCVTNAVNGYEWVATENKMEGAKLNICSQCSSAGEVGVWLSHLATWRLGIKHNIPIISLEADTTAIANWNVSPEVYKDYDIIFLHHNQLIPKKCWRRGKDGVFEGIQYWFGAGAMLFTNNNPDKVKRVWEEELINGSAKMPVDHWFNHLYSEKKLKVGSLCPTFFRQLGGHTSTISEGKRWNPAKHPDAM